MAPPVPLTDVLGASAGCVLPGGLLPDHPHYEMWKARREAELAAERDRALRRAARDTERQQWDEAWVHYRRHWYEGFLPGRGVPPWWHLREWLRLLFGKPR